MPTDTQTVTAADLTDLLAGWWCELNRWGWPKELGEPEPHGPGHDDCPRRDAMMDLIKTAIGMKACLHKWTK